MNNLENNKNENNSNFQKTNITSQVNETKTKTLEIVTSKNQKIVFNSEKITALFIIDSIKIDENNYEKKFWLLKKQEFHATIIWTKTWEKINEILNNLDNSQKKQILEKIVNLFWKYTWDLNFKNEYYYIEKDVDENEKRKSVIQIIDLPDIDKFYFELNSILKTNFEIPFNHLTIYTNSTLEKNKLRWIWIYSKKQFFEFNPKKI